MIKLYSWEGHVKTPKFSNIDTTIKILSKEYDIELVYCNVDKRWFRKKVSFKVKGSKENLDKFRDYIRSIVDEWVII